jgi:uncharacterized protein Yka (UPF0111/DUF47 family)
MTMREEDGAMNRVLRHFPDRAAEVQALASVSDPFRDMCVELGAADLALEHLRTATVPHRQERLAECEGWIDRLTAEMGAELARSRVVPLHRKPEGGGR